MDNREFINIYNGSRNNQRIIYTNSLFIRGEIIVKVLSDKIIFLKPDINYAGKTYKSCKCLNSKNYQFTVKAELPLGKYYFDVDESNENCMVVYFK